MIKEYLEENDLKKYVVEIEKTKNKKSFMNVYKWIWDEMSKKSVVKRSIAYVKERNMFYDMNNWENVCYFNYLAIMNIITFNPSVVSRDTDNDYESSSCSNNTNCSENSSDNSSDDFSDNSYDENSFESDDPNEPAEYIQNCYEHGDHIQYYLTQFNKLGLFTECSQPSQRRPNRQTAFLDSIVSKDLGRKIYEKIKDDDRLIVQYDLEINKPEYEGGYIVTYQKNENYEPGGRIWFETKDTIYTTYSVSCGDFILPLKILSQEKTTCLKIVDMDFGNPDEYLWKTVLKALQES